MTSFITTFCALRNRQVLTPAGRRLVDASGTEEFLLRLYEDITPSYPKFYKMDTLSRFGFLAAEILLKDYPLTAYTADAVSVVLSNANASLDTDLQFENSLRTMASPALFVYTLPNIVAGEICIRQKINGENAFFISPAFDAPMMEQYLMQALLQEHTHACIAGWVDVLGDSYDVFLYLVEKEKRGLGIAHRAEELIKLYNQ